MAYNKKDDQPEIPVPVHKNPQSLRQQTPTSNPNLPYDVKENSVAELSGQGKKRHPGPWVKMTPQESREYQEKGVLLGYDPVKGEGLLKKEYVDARDEDRDKKNWKGPRAAEVEANATPILYKEVKDDGIVKKGYSSVKEEEK